MSYKFTLEEIIELALKIEDNGYNFYTKYSNITKSQEVRKVFDFLAANEVEHHEVYQKLLYITKHSLSKKNYFGDNEFYLKALSRESIFSDYESTETYVNSLKGDKQALEFALSFEFDSIDFFNVLKKSVSLKEKGYVNKIILEEKQHCNIIKNLLIDKKQLN